MMVQSGSAREAGTAEILQRRQSVITKGAVTNLQPAVQPYSFIALNTKSPAFGAIFRARGWEIKQEEVMTI